MVCSNRIAALLVCQTMAAIGLAGANSQGPSPSENVRFDFYSVGVKLGELKLEAVDGTRFVSLRRRDSYSRDWGTPERTALDSAEGISGLRLPRAFRNLIQHFGSLEKTGWSDLPAVGWPDAETIYVRQPPLVRTIGGKTVSCDYWSEKDASNPLDLVFDSENRLVAAIQVSTDSLLVRPDFENFTTLERWRAPGVSQPDHGIRSHGKFQVRMADGTHLTTLVYLPDGKTRGPFPVILVRTPYGVGNLIERYWHHVTRGYAVVLQACRGTAYWDSQNRSEGNWELVINEPSDGADTLEWVTRQPWSNGSIGMQGGSYVGYTQWAATLADNPALKCIVPEVSMGTVFSDQPYMGGGFVSGLAYYMLFMLDEKLLPERTWTEVLHHRPLIDLDKFATGRDISQWNTLLQNWSSGGYWRRQDWYNADLKREFASFQISGWFDDDFPGTRANWELMQRKGKLPQRLVIGPWKHGYNRDRRLNGFSFGPNSLRDDIPLLKQRWYDRFLKGLDNGIDTRVDYFVLGENRWRTASRWPPADAAVQKWFLDSAGEANRDLTDGLLVLSPPDGPRPSDVYTYDPRDPAPNWMSFEHMTRWEDVQSFPYDFKDIERRHDVAVYTSAPLEEDLTVAGDIRLVLYASTDARDTDWWFHLSDVSPTNESVRLTVGMQRARFRNLADKDHGIFGSNFEKEELLSGRLDEVVRYQITIPSIANTFRKGHRVRIAVMNACDYYSFPNSNTGGDEARVAHTLPGTMKIHHSLNAASHLLLPVLPASVESRP